MQTDIKLRGSAYSQVLVLINGIRINDSQTGHHNADFPVPLQDVERVEVLLGPGSSLYGADAVGGIVNVITRRSDRTVHSSFSGGQNGFMEGSFSAGFQKGKFEQSISASGNRSSGFMYDREFRSVTVNARSNFGDRSTLMVSYGNKDFGANGFYGPAPSKEWTNQTLISFEHRYNSKSGAKTVFQSFYRSHGDRFLYDIRTPDRFENRHRTHAAGILAKTQLPLTHAGLLTLGTEAGGDWIASSNLGDHAFGRASLFTELQWSFGKSAMIYPGVRFDYYSNFGSSVNPSLSGSWWILPRLRLRSAVGRAFRIPTFTELYYRDPNNEATPTLKPESAWSAELGTDFVPATNWLASFTFFSRKEQNVIDWIRSVPTEKWRTHNIRNLHSDGFEVGVVRSFGTQSRLETHYSRISMDAGAIDYISKYVLDYARHSWSSSVHFPLPLRFQYQQSLSYKKRADGRSYWIMNSSLERRFHQLVASVDFKNLLNSQYQEIRGVDMPGRWFVVGLRTR
jgi:outer membrane cobalamin receptor